MNNPAILYPEGRSSIKRKKYMEKQAMFPDPEKKLNIIRRYLHILALLQNNKDPMDWNGSTLANILTLDEADRPLTDKTIRDYIKDNLMGELELPIDMEKGGRRIELAQPLADSILERVINIYSLFVVTDSSRDVILHNFIQRHPYDCLWLLGRIYFAALDRKRIEFDYITNSGQRIHNLLNPYHLVFRNNNLYLVGRLPDRDRAWIFIANRMENLKVTDQRFDDTVPPVDEIFQDTLGSFIGEKYHMKIRFDRDLLPVMEQILGILEPEITEDDGGEHYQASFTVSDDRYLCKQLFLYGGRVEILEPKEMRDLMIKMLRESMGVYGLKSFM
jgi:hypothetical protein